MMCPGITIITTNSAANTGSLSMPSTTANSGVRSIEDTPASVTVRQRSTKPVIAVPQAISSASTYRIFIPPIHDVRAAMPPAMPSIIHRWFITRSMCVFASPLPSLRNEIFIPIQPNTGSANHNQKYWGLCVVPIAYHTARVVIIVAYPHTRNGRCALRSARSRVWSIALSITLILCSGVRLFFSIVLLFCVALNENVVDNIEDKRETKTRRNPKSPI